MLDILEGFINSCGFTYIRFDGSVAPEQRQRLVEQFTSNERIFLFIASTRAGGVGINLTGADVVIFYDSDWNPAMDRQAMDRCHRIGQTRDVNIYRLISEFSIEENILRKQMEKRKLDDIVVDQGHFTSVGKSEYYSRVDVREMLYIDKSLQDDIYGTHILHDTMKDEDTIAHVPKDVRKERAEFEAALARLEDQEDQAALNQTRKECSEEKVEFEEEFGNAGEDVPPVASSPTSAPESPVAVVGPKSPVHTDSRRTVQVDDKTSIEVTPVVDYAVRFTETVHIPENVGNEIRAMRLRVKEELPEDIPDWDDNVIGEIEGMQWESQCSSADDKMTDDDT
eukprot:GHVO01049546.1.p1 GENE.GHVO01049546.1~~GHVO01049546.1.p1  ORF type:complete len:365 (-),score=79.99 GHVO01049546.1:151-1167(-)